MHPLLQSGPRRVVINQEGNAVPPVRCPEHLRPQVVFVRNDGWTLGATRRLALTAWRLWSAEWVKIVFLPGGQEEPLNAEMEAKQIRALLRKSRNVLE